MYDFDHLTECEQFQLNQLSNKHVHFLRGEGQQPAKACYNNIYPIAEILYFYSPQNFFHKRIYIYIYYNCSLAKLLVPAPLMEILATPLLQALLFIQPITHIALTPDKLFNSISKRLIVNFKALKISQLFAMFFIGKSTANSSVNIKYYLIKIKINTLNKN